MEIQTNGFGEPFGSKSMSHVRHRPLISAAISLAGMLIAVGPSAAIEPATTQQSSFALNMIMRESGLGLLKLERVQRELQLTEDQCKQIGNFEANARALNEKLPPLPDPSSAEFMAKSAELNSKMWEAARDIQHKLSAVLTGQQGARLLELKIQILGAWNLFKKPISRDLGVTDEQALRLREIRAAAGRDIAKANERNDVVRRTALLEAMENKLYAVLASEQFVKFEKMQGKKLKFSEDELWTARGFPGPPAMNSVSKHAAELNGAAPPNENRKSSDPSKKK
jgi:hypothetical protein